MAILSIITNKRTPGIDFSYLFFLMIWMCLMVSRPGLAQEGSNPKKWSLETSLTFAPAAHIYMLKTSYQYSENSVLGIGVAFQNWKNNNKTPQGQAHAYTLLLSYRYFFWKNFHIELELWPAYNHFNSFSDGKVYKGFELWAEYKVGYKLTLSKQLYINFQPGLAHGFWMQNKWPEFKDYTPGEMISKTFVFVPQVMIGWNL